MGLISDGTTIFDAGAMSLGGSMVLIKKIAISSAASTVSFVNGASDVVLDGTYKQYIFTLTNIHPSENNTGLKVGFRDGGSAYDAPKTTTFFRARHEEDGSAAGIEYETGHDLAESNDFHSLSANTLGTGNDESFSGYIHLFDPASTTFHKHFITRGNVYHAANISQDNHTSGYINTTTAIDAVQFKMTSDTIEAGTITLYGIS